MDPKTKIGLRMPEMNTAQYLKFWNGPFSMTEKEILMLSALIDSPGELCSRENREVTATRTNSSITMINTYIKRIKDKKALKKFNGVGYKLAPLLVRRDTITINFSGPT